MMEPKNVSWIDILGFLIALFIFLVVFVGISYLFIEAYIFVCDKLLIFWLYLFYPSKKAQSKKVIWFTRRVVVKELSKIGEKELKAMEDAERSKCTRLNIIRNNVMNYIFTNKLFEFLVKKRNEEIRLWIPLNDTESAQIEEYYQSNNPGNLNPPIVLNGLFKVSNEKCKKLTSICWQNENAVWLLMRGEYVCEIPSSPPPLYFMNIKPDNKLKFYYQPVVVSDETSIKDEYDFSQFRAINKTNDNQHVIFVIHGIGHHEGEEGIVENANDIRDGFVKYIKKFHPTFPTPLVIPIAWRCNLKLDDERICATQPLKFDLAEKLGIILNEPFYYSTEYKKQITKSLIRKLNDKYKCFVPDVSNGPRKPNVSILAHSLGSVIAFDILHEEHRLEERNGPKKLNFDVENIFLIGSPLARFLINTKFDVDELRNNKWIKNGKLFNIINPDDPVAHRLEALFDSVNQADLENPEVLVNPEIPVNPENKPKVYKYVEPIALSLDEISTETTLELSLHDQYKFVKFHKKFAVNRAMEHNSFRQIDYCKKKYADLTENSILPKEIINKFYETEVVSATNIEIEEDHRIPSRLDYNLFHTKYRPEFIDFETYSFAWAKKFAFAHTSYWKSLETIALMTNVIYGYGSGPEEKKHDVESKQAKISHGITNFLWTVCPSLILTVCRFMCTICLINHAEPLLLVAQYYKKRENVYFKKEMFKTHDHIVQIFLYSILVLQIIDAFKEKLNFIYSYRFHIFAVFYFFCLTLLDDFSEFVLFHQILYHYFLILFTIKLPNLHKPVGLVWNILDFYGNNFSKLFLYFLFFLPSIILSLISYIFENSDFSTVYFIFCHSYTFTMLICSVLHYLFKWSSTHVNSDKWEHVSSPDKTLTNCFRVNILCKKQNGNELEFGCVKKKRFSNETDELDQLCTVICRIAIFFYILYVFSIFWCHLIVCSVTVVAVVDIIFSLNLCDMLFAIIIL